MIITTANNVGMADRHVHVAPDERIFASAIAEFALEALVLAKSIGVELVVVRAWNDTFTECYGDVMVTEGDAMTLARIRTSGKALADRN